MVKMVLQDFYSTKWSVLRKNMANAVIYMCGIISVVHWLFAGKSISTGQEWLASIQLLFLVWGKILHLCFPNSLVEPMYLIPMNGEEKKKYLYTRFWVKQYLISVPHMIYNFWLITTDKIPAWKASYIVVCLFACGVQQGFSVRIDLGQVKKEYLNDGKEVLFLFATLIMYFLLVRTEFQEMFLWEKSIFVIAFLAQIILFPWILKRVGIKLEAGTDFQTWKSIRQKEGKSGENCN